MNGQRDPSMPPPAVQRSMRARQHPVETVVEGPPPEVQAVPGRKGITATVRCPFCLQRHTHGLGKDRQSYGSRLSHCSDRPPRAYFLVPAPVALA